MEFSKYLGVADDECSSSESGWTMYIVSSMHDNNHHHHGHGHGHGIDHVYHDGNGESHGDCYYMHQNEDSDDSMVSDASSAPSRQGIARGNTKKRSGLRRESKHALSQKQVEKKLYDRRQRALKEEELKTRIDVKAKKAK